MAITATYASATSFTVSTDRTSEFNPGRAVYCDCGVDGIKYAYVDYSSYSSPNTTVYLNSNESQSITLNLTEVLLSRVKAEAASGNLPLNVLWAIRGHKSGLILSWKDADEIYIDAGSLHINNGSTERIYTAPSQLTKQLTSLSASTWYAIYVDPPDNGLILTASDIEYSSTMPSYSQSKRGWYHSSNTDWRCIGFIYANSSSEVTAFSVSGNVWLFTDMANWFVSNATPSNTWTAYTVPVPMGDMAAYVHIAYLYSNANAALVMRKTGQTGSSPIAISYVSNNIARQDTVRFAATNSSKQIDLKIESSSTNSVYINIVGFVMPAGM